MSVANTTAAQPRPTQPLAALPEAGIEEVGRRAQAIRSHVLRTVATVGEGYLLQALGAADIFASLYFSELRLDPADPAHPERDRCLLCTAHNSVGLYATLAERGCFPVQELESYGQDGSAYEIIGSEQVKGVEGTFGSLGQGLSVAVGFALSARLRRSEWRTYAILGDGEMQEGQTWEAAMAAAAYRLDNLCLIVDLNGMQVEGATDSVMPMGEVAPKWRAFGWTVQEVDGHDVGQLLQALQIARGTKGCPSAIVAKTIPGHPISFLQGRLEHYAKLSPQQAEQALAELDASTLHTEPDPSTLHTEPDPSTLHTEPDPSTPRTEPDPSPHTEPDPSTLLLAGKEPA
jgi:transketolase